MHIDKIFKVDPELEINEKLVSIHAINPFANTVSSARQYMFSSHFSQAITINKPEERIIQTGLERQLATNTFSIKTEDDCRILSIMYRYGSSNHNDIVSKILIVQYIESNEIDYIEIPRYFSLHQHFGFKYKPNKEVLQTLTVGTILPKNTILADSPGVTDNGGYAFGINANVLLAGIPDTSEDAVVISKSCADKFTYTVYETRIISFGSSSIPINLYGDIDNYKPFPSIGQKVNQNGVLMAVRKLDPVHIPSLMTKRDLSRYDPLFDDGIYVRGPGTDIEINGELDSTGVVVDIKAYHNPKSKKFSGMEQIGDLEKYVNGMINHYDKLINIVEEYDAQHKKFYNTEANVSPKLRRLLMDAYILTNKQNNKIRLVHRNEPLDIYRVEITVEYKVKIVPGSKITDLYGSKGIVVDIVDDNLMPYNTNGVRADMILDPTSIPSRVNPGRLYEQYFNGATRETQRLLREMASDERNVDKLSTDKIEEMYKFLLGFYNIFETEQSMAYNAVSDINIKKEILSVCLNKEVYLQYKLSSKKKPYQITTTLRDSVYAPKIGNIVFNVDGVLKDSFMPMMIAPMYIMLLAKTADTYLSTASPKTNHYGIPIGVGNSNKHTAPYRNSPTKIGSETETRLISAFAGRKAISELKDRATSPSSHRHIYRNILEADVPTNIPNVIDRNKVPYGTDAALTLVNSIYEASGLKLTYVHDEHTKHKE